MGIYIPEISNLVWFFVSYILLHVLLMVSEIYYADVLGITIKFEMYSIEYFP